MVLKTKIKTVFFILVCFFPSILQSAELSASLPADAVLISQKGPFFGPMKSIHRQYKSSWNKNRLESFFRKELLREGWKEEKNDKMTFLKEDNVITIDINQYQDRDDRTGFLISSGRIPQKEEILAISKKNPDKLNFMPIYPGSEQVSLWDTQSGVAAEYETGRTIKEVAFFFKSGMLNYGWRLISETPQRMAVTSCPGCEKFLSPGTAKTYNADKVEEQISLVFRRAKDESCSIEISGIFSNVNKESVGKTKISVHYHKYDLLKR